MIVHQFVHTLNYGDAISTEAIAIRRLLRGGGIESNIYSMHAHEKVQQLTAKADVFASDLARAKAEQKEVAVVLHYSIGSPLNTIFSEADVKRALIYHNLTPVHWFSRYNTRVAEDLRVGFKELPSLVEKSHVVLADSAFNREELLKISSKSIQVLPLFFDEKQWDESANRGIVDILRGHGGKNLLCVGRLAPNKKVEDIIKSFYFYHHKIERKSRLWIIGGDMDTEIYSFELRRLVAELRLKEAVTFVGSVSSGELRAFYENSDAYLCMSEHEGFCLPLLEAMFFGTPVIAFDSCAVAETVGEGGIVLASKNPAEVAELLNVVLGDEQLRKNLVERGKKRVSQFSEQRFAEDLQQKLCERIAELGSETRSSLTTTPVSY